MDRDKLIEPLTEDQREALALKLTLHPCHFGSECAYCDRIRSLLAQDNPHG